MRDYIVVPENADEDWGLDEDLDSVVPEDEELDFPGHPDVIPDKELEGDAE